ncbi:unnamed protein product [Didymodactylos carnosus]|uniref:VOC domain-containing protein n=1 Tax=Didymodactylos carnosus TaxID=1234261 RepID=A0A814SHN2_9BILA|nr:unnamed protein product [Didymodactylos carnosus]CAF1146147.1 unnamed protein product [Didymodactylos carnosus]CAF3815044.1 unnamed protein product [Didymodactylos carnosus]CAF3909726.1 unnamed protein product [Didymodactylos carnosus]
MASPSIATNLSLRLTHNILRVSNPKELINFYIEKFGMKEGGISQSASETYNISTVGYLSNPKSVQLEFHNVPNKSYTSQHKNEGRGVYWKIGVTLRDVDLAVDILQKKNVHVSNGKQFEDIGYLCHLSDPNDFTIELLQHDFKQNFRKPQPDTNFPELKQPACIGQITLNVSDIKKTLTFYEQILGMKLLSIQDVSQYGFKLYFLAWTDEEPPKKRESNDKRDNYTWDLYDATQNREWLWKRPYTTIELKHGGSVEPFVDLKDGDVGFEGLRITCNNLTSFETYMESKGIPVKNSSQGSNGRERVIRDPDNIPIFVTEDKNA